MANHPFSTINHTDASLAAAIDHLPYGIAVFDARLDLVVANAPYRAGLALPASLLTPGTPMDGILLFMAQRGDLGPGTPQVLADQRRRLITAEATTLTQRTNFTGLQIGRASCRERADDPADADAKNTRSTRATASV